MSLVVVDGGKADLLANLRTYLIANSYLHLFTNNHTPSHYDVVGTYTEANFSGYSSIALNSWGAPYLTSDFHEYVDEVLRTFTNSGITAQTVYGYYVTNGSIGALWWAELAPAPVVVSALGGSFSVQPRFSLTSEF
jgi:hypothetical protein